jgi:hypothetical protein
MVTIGETRLLVIRSLISRERTKMLGMKSFEIRLSHLFPGFGHHILNWIVITAYFYYYTVEHNELHEVSAFR